MLVDIAMQDLKPMKLLQARLASFQVVYVCMPCVWDLAHQKSDDPSFFHQMTKKLWPYVSSFNPFVDGRFAIMRWDLPVEACKLCNGWEMEL